MKNIVKATVMICALAAAPLLAQTGQSGQSQGRGASANAADTGFAKEAAIGGMAEVELGNLAKEKAASNDVKQFGERMATDHGKANSELKQWAQKNNITLPTELDAKHKATRDRLAKLSGAAFDKAYMHDMLIDHQQDVAAFKKQSTSGKDAELKAWAGQTLPTLQEHLKLAQDTASKVGAAGKGEATKKSAPKK